MFNLDLTYLQVDVRQIRIELQDIRTKLEEMEERIARVAITSKEDTGALTADVVNLKKRVSFLENQLKELQSAK